MPALPEQETARTLTLLLAVQARTALVCHHQQTGNTFTTAATLAHRLDRQRSILALQVRMPLRQTSTKPTSARHVPLDSTVRVEHLLLQDRVLLAFTVLQVAGFRSKFRVPLERICQQLEVAAKETASPALLETTAQQALQRSRHARWARTRRTIAPPPQDLQLT